MRLNASNYGKRVKLSIWRKPGSGAAILKAALSLVFVVSWRLSFWKGWEMQEFNQERRFDTCLEALVFFKHAPRESFECVEHFYGRSGMCAVSDMRVEEVP